MNRTLLLITAILWSFSCSAHGTADNHLQIVVIDNRIKMNITVDMRVLQMVDKDGDGYASLAELRQQTTSLRDWVRTAFDVTDQTGSEGDVIFADITSDLDIARENGDRVDHARILQTLEFATAPQALEVNLGDLATRVPELRVTIIDASTGLKYRLLDPMQRRTVSMPAP